MKINKDGKIIIIANLILIVFIALFYTIKNSHAVSPHHEHDTSQNPPQEHINYYNTYEVTEVINATDAQIQTAVQAIQDAQTLDATSLNSTSLNYDKCHGVAIAMAGANNQMSIGTDKPQLSVGIGECDGEFASSLMFGVRINPKILINGSWATDEDVNAFGLGLNMVFK